MSVIYKSLQEGEPNMKRRNFYLLVLIAGIIAMVAVACDSGKTIHQEPITDGDQEQIDMEGVDYEEGNLPPGGCLSDNDCAVLSQCKKNTSDVGGCACLSGVCVPKPKKEAAIFWEDSHPKPDDTGKEGEYKPCDAEHCGGTSVDTSCNSETYEQVDGETPKTKVNGLIKVFGLEAPCNVLSVYVFLEYDENGQLNDFQNNENAVAVAEHPGDPDPVNGECPVIIEDVPTDKWLVIKSTDFNGQFKDTYQYNVFIKSEDADNDTGFPLEINSISESSYQLVPVTAGITGGIRSDRGAIAGTVKDCSGNLIQYATVGVTGDTKKIAYFNSNVEDLLPDSGRTTTNMDGTWVSLNHAEGEWDAVAAALIDGQIVASKKIHYRMYRNSVIIVPFRFNNPINYYLKTNE